MLNDKPHYVQSSPRYAKCQNIKLHHAY